MNPTKPVAYDITVFYTEGSKQWKATEPLPLARTHLLRCLASITLEADDIIRIKADIKWQGKRGNCSASFDVEGDRGIELIDALDDAIYSVR